ncbi:MAG: hypothetical protein OXU45_00440 [Candidatus Melainabacteria bacterium]|nr:hypothetical protein [Candidatus Melainabacteria bacterium]
MFSNSVVIPLSFDLPSCQVHACEHRAAQARINDLSPVFRSRNQVIDLLHCCPGYDLHPCLIRKHISSREDLATALTLFSENNFDQIDGLVFIRT